MPKPGAGDDDWGDLSEKERQYDVEWKRYWKCPNCEHVQKRHHAKRDRPFCAPCEWQYGTLVEMKPYKEGERVSLDG